MQSSERGWFFALGFLSIAGIPPLVGFMPKFLISLSGISCGMGVVVIGFLVASVVHVGYYIDVVVRRLSSQAIVGWYKLNPGIYLTKAKSLKVFFLGAQMFGGLALVVRVSDMFV